MSKTKQHSTTKSGKFEASEPSAVTMAVWIDGNMVEMELSKFSAFQINAINNNAFYSNQIGDITIYSLDKPYTPNIGSPVVVKRLTTPIQNMRPVRREEIQRVVTQEEPFVTNRIPKSASQIEEEQTERYSKFIDNIIDSEDEETEMIKWSIKRFAKKS
jgi:hypothetical protein